MFGPIHFSPQETPDGISLLGTVMVLEHLRALVEAGIVIPFGHFVHFCSRCWEKRFGPITNSIIDGQYDSFNVTFLPTKNSRRRPREFAFRIEGPQEIVPNGSRLYACAGVPNIVKEAIASHKNRAFAFTADLVRESRILEPFFEPATEDFVLQGVLGKQTGCTYVSDRNLEVRMFQALSRMKTGSTRVRRY